MTIDISSNPKTDLSDSHKKERIWQSVELKKNEQHCSGLHFLAQLAQPPSGNLATAYCLTLETNAFFSTRQHCPRPSKMYIRYLYPPSNIFVVSLFFYRQFNIALFQNRFQISLSTSLYFLSLRYMYCPQKYC